MASLGVGLATLGIMLATEPRMAIVWDEGYTLGREARLRTWFHALRDPADFARHWTPPTLELVQQAGASAPAPEAVNTRGKLLLDTQVLAYFWPFARAEPHGHPPFYALLGLLGDLLTPSWQDLPRARLGPIALFSVTAGFLFWFCTRRWGLVPGLAAAAAWVFQPNLFGHGHYAAYDGVLTSLWALAIMAFAEAVPPGSDAGRSGSGRDRRPHAAATLVFGLVLGCAQATKLTGWFLPLPFLFWTAWTRDRRAALALLLGLPLALGVLLICNPPWWTEPLAGVLRFFDSNLSRGQTIPIPVQFLGLVYLTPRESLPWYNTLVWTVLVTPVGLLLLAILGTLRGLRQRQTDRIGVLVVANWVLLIVLRALPHTPGHDGVRLFLPAFGVLSFLVAMGARQAIDALGGRARMLVAAAMAEAVASVCLFMPVPLSYFSPLACGLPGAVRLGMEPTYYWDALDARARQWLREQTHPGETVRFASFPTSWLYLRQVGELPHRLEPLDRGLPAWYVLQNRPAPGRRWTGGW